MQNLINEDPEIAAEEVRILGRLKKMVEEQGENEEILQTKIISPKEVLTKLDRMGTFHQK